MWYAAHTILYFEMTDPAEQDGYAVYENLFLIQAETPDQARAKAEVFARRDEGDDRGSLRINGQPGRLGYGGSRKVVSVAHERSDGQLGAGDELTYSEFFVVDRASLDRLISGKDVELLYRGVQK
jgi:hypothetical protein